MAKELEQGAEGIIQAVDPVGRELTMQIGGAVMTLYVPLDCSIMLNAERVRMRLLQPMDRAFVRYTRRSDYPIARSIVVNWGTGYPQAAPPQESAAARSQSGDEPPHCQNADRFCP